ncbi:MAG: tagatose-bisphosphate aldolase subunit GatY [Oscillospiraceae bacterium]
MPMTTSKELLLNAQRGGYAVGAFNVENMEMVQAVVEAAIELNSPAIIQTTPSTLRYGEPKMYAAMVRAAAEQAPVPIALHLDHGESFALAAKALRAGYTSIMIDGSHSPFEENIAISRRVVEMAEAMGIPVEAELGKVGGKEDDLDGGAGGLTDPADAVKFVAETGISSLAVAIGTAHGLYAGEPKLDIPRLKAIRKVVEIPLVLHGASGLSKEQVQECIREGCCKVNFATELRIAYSEGVKAVFADKPDTFDPKAYGKVGREKVKELVKHWMTVCGSNGKF